MKYELDEFKIENLHFGKNQQQLRKKVEFIVDIILIGFSFSMMYCCCELRWLFSFSFFTKRFAATILLALLKIVHHLLQYKTSQRKNKFSFHLLPVLVCFHFHSFLFRVRERRRTYPFFSLDIFWWIIVLPQQNESRVGEWGEGREGGSKD